MFDKKAQIPIIKVIVVIIITGILFTSFMVYLFLASDIPTRSPQLKQQLIYSNLFSENCLMTNKNIILKSNFNRDKINDCLQNFGDSSIIRVSLRDSNEDIIKGPIYTTSLEDFQGKNNFCDVTANNLCSSQLSIPVKSSKGEQMYANLIIITPK